MKKLICALALAAVLALPVRAESAADRAEALYPALDGNGAAAARAAETETGFDLNGGINAVLRVARDNLGSVLAAAVGSAAAAAAAALVGVVCAGAFPSAKSAVSAASSVGVVLAGAGGLTSAVGAAAALQTRLAEFSALIFPVLTAASAAAGNGGEAVMRQSAVALFSDAAVQAGDRLLWPLIGVILAARLGGEVSGTALMTRTADGIRNGFMGAVRIFLMLFVGYITISGAAGRAADSLALRSARTAAASVPYVGGVVGEAADAVLAGAGVMRSQLGVFGVVAVLGSAVVPLLSCGLGWGTMKLVAALCASLPEAVGSGAAAAVADAMGVALAFCAGTTALILLSLTVCMGAGG